MIHIPRPRASRFFAFLLCLGLAATSVRAADDDKDAPPPFDPKTATGGEDLGVGIISPYDKFIALQQVLKGKKISWAQLFDKIAVSIPAAVPDQDVILPLLLGARISDGVMAIQARDVERLNRCASEIERGAKTLKVPDGSLTRARQLRTVANAGEWLKVFMELGYLQKDVMDAVDAKENRVKGTIVILGGWMQGVRYASQIVTDNYSGEVSNYLRDPMLIRGLTKMIDKLPERERNHPLMVKMRASMQEIYEIVNIPLDGQIPLERVQRVHALSSEIITQARGQAK